MRFFLGGGGGGVEVHFKGRWDGGGVFKVGVVGGLWVNVF